MRVHETLVYVNCPIRLPYTLRQRMIRALLLIGVLDAYSERIIEVMDRIRYIRERAVSFVRLRIIPLYRD